MAYHRYKHGSGSYYRGRSRSGRYYTRKGCYVATCVYGSYDCPEVWTLRRFRDYSLENNLFGRGFIRLYYKVSPTLVRWFGNTKWFKVICRNFLDKLVNRRQEKGYSSKPYCD